jgi:hypothetical protein
MARKSKKPKYVTSGSPKPIASDSATPICLPVTDTKGVLCFFAIPRSDEEILLTQPAWQLGETRQKSDLLMLRAGASRPRYWRWGSRPRFVWIADFPPLADKDTMHELFTRYCESTGLPTFFPRTWTLGAQSDLKPKHSAHEDGFVTLARSPTFSPLTSVPVRRHYVKHPCGAGGIDVYFAQGASEVDAAVASVLEVTLHHYARADTE